uniref:Uncharacterized protein n=1 Tax=Chelydra serpentina TaxID=8475 RepID=A0A8C3XQF9_CHESE
EIKHFLKEDSEEAELAQFLKEFPSGESFRKVEPEEGKRAHGQGPIDPGMFSSVAWPIADELLDDKELRPFSQPRPLDFQQHIAAPAPPSPSRPRSPWGKLDPYDSSEVRGLSLPPGLSLLGGEDDAVLCRSGWVPCAGPHRLPQPLTLSACSGLRTQLPQSWGPRRRPHSRQMGSVVISGGSSPARRELWPPSAGASLPSAEV